MRIHYKILCELFLAAFLLSLSSLAEDPNKPEVKKVPATEQPPPASKPEQDTAKKQEPAKPDQASPTQEEPTPETPPAEDKPDQASPTQEEPIPETPPAEDKPSEAESAQQEATSEPPPDTAQAETIDESQFPDAKPADEKLPYAKGDMEADLSVALAGAGNDFYFGVAGSYGYYIADRFSLGIYIQYTHIFSDATYDYKPPESIMFLPFVKFAITRSKSVSPYIFVTGGYEGKWTYNAEEDLSSSPNGWLLGGGGGVHVGITKQVVINIRLLGAYKWYANTQIYRYKDSDLYHNANEAEGGTFKCELDDQCNYFPDDYIPNDTDLHLTRNENGEEVDYLCTDATSCKQIYDKKDKKSEGLFPLITLGVTVFF